MKIWYKAKAKKQLSKLLTVKEDQLVNYKIFGDAIYIRFAEGQCIIGSKDIKKYIEPVLIEGKLQACRSEVSEYIENEINTKKK